jgi:para-aminobenzoate synthetase component 1
MNTKMNITIKPLALGRKHFSDKVETLNAQAIFTVLAHMPWSTWLDSCDSTHVDSRFDILVWQPEITLSTFGEVTHIYHYQNQQTQTSTQDPLLLVKQSQQTLFEQYQLPPTKENDNFPFKGGAVGYFAYDLGRRFERLPKKAEQDIHLPEMAVGIYLQAIIFDNKTQRCFLVCPEDKRQEINLWLTEKLVLENKRSSAKAAKNSFSLTSNWQSNMNKQAYSDKFTQVQHYLLSGDCYQINLAQRFSAQYQGDEFDAYCALRTANQAPFSAFMRFEEATILSISPERFLQLHDNKVQSKPIKGTKPRSSDPKTDQENALALKKSAKDQAENVMIVDLLRNDISKVCQAGSVIVPELFTIESFPAVHHLVSTVEGELSPKYDGTDLLRAAFPGGSITGAPKIRAMEIIENLEPQRRSVYCGSIGYLSACGNMDTSITIRTLVCQSDSKLTGSASTKSIYCWAGGGLVADSSVECEYQETFDKVQRILPVLSDL